MGHEGGVILYCICYQNYLDYSRTVNQKKKKNCSLIILVENDLILNLKRNINMNFYDSRGMGRRAESCSWAGA